MKNLKQGIAKISATLVLVLGLCFAVNAQIPPPPTPTGAPVQVPLDGGVIILAVAGAAYGAKKVYAKRKK